MLQDSAGGRVCKQQQQPQQRLMQLACLVSALSLRSCSSSCAAGVQAVLAAATCVAALQLVSCRHPVPVGLVQVL